MPRMSYKARREFAKEMLEHAFFGAFHLVIGARKNEEDLTRSQLGVRMGREKTGISKLFSGPRNWQLSTISDLSEALDVRLEFSLIDKHFPARRFTASGVVYNTPAAFSFNELPTINVLPIEQNTIKTVHGMTIEYSTANQYPPILIENAVGVGIIAAGYTSGSTFSVTTPSGALTKAVSQMRPQPVLPPPGSVPIPTILGSMVG